MARITETLDGGLVTIMDAALLKPGQISDARNCHYFPGVGSLQRAQGRTSLAQVSVAATAVYGLRDIQFDNGDHYLVAAASSVYRTSPIEGAGAFTDLATGLSAGVSLEAVQYLNRYYLFNGATAAATAIDTNQVCYLSATAAGSAPQIRQHGMLAVDAPPNITTAAGTFSQTVTGYYEYWTTEVFKGTQDGVRFTMEGTFSGVSATTVFVPSTATVPTIQMPTLKNAITTHWRIYRSPKKTLLTDVKFPTGFMVAEMSTATAAQADSSVATTGPFLFPGSFNAAASAYSDFSNAATISAIDALYASGVVPAGGGTKAQGCYNFNFAGNPVVGNVNGITVELKAYVSAGTAPAPITVTLGYGRKASNGDFAGGVIGGNGFTPYASPFTASKSGVIVGTTPGTATVLTLGGTTDPWLSAHGRPFSSTDFDANFMVVIKISQAGITMGVDYLRLQVSYGATQTGDSTTVFPTVVYTFGDVIAQVGKNGPPPSSNCADTFEDCLVVNDLSNRGLVRYSFPGNFDAFPGTYFLDFQTRERDQVRCIKAVGTRLVVCLDSSTWRLNYLPSERDASFDRGKAVEPISKSFGCVNPMCACTFSADSGQELMAFVSNQGIHTTDGFSFETLTDGIDWRTIISLTSISSPIALINDRERRLLLFYFRNDSYGNETYLCLPFNYHGSHLQYSPLRMASTYAYGKPKPGGLIHMRNYDSGSTSYASLESAWVSPRLSGGTSVYLGYGGPNAAPGGGYAFIEGGTNIPSNDSTYKYTTRTFYMSEFSGEWELGEVYGFVPSYTGTPTVSYTAKTSKTNDTGETTQQTKTIVLGGQKLHKVTHHQMAEGLRLTCQVTASAYAQDFIVLDHTSFGLEDSGR